MSRSSLTDAQLRSVLRRIRDQVDGPVEPRYIESIDRLSFELFVARFGSLAQACLEAGCDYVVETPDPTVYAAGAADADSRQQLITDLRRLVREQELRPTIENLNSYGHQQYDRQSLPFGSWPAAVLEAGLDPTDIPGYVSPAEVVAELRRLSDRIGVPPSSAFAAEYGEIDPAVYDTRFPSWEVALQSAELDPEQVDTKRELRTGLELLAAALEHRPNAAEIDLYTETEAIRLRRAFGSIDAALAAADIPAERDLTPTGSLTDPVHSTAAIPSHTDLLRDIFTVRRRYSGPKRNLDDPEEQRRAFGDRGIIDERHFDVQFGSLTAAFEYADGLDAKQFRSPRKERVGDVPPQILSDHAWDLAEILDRRPLVDEVIALTDHTLEEYLDAFPSWEAVFDGEYARTDGTETPNVRPTNTEFRESIEEVGAAVGRPPTPETYRELGYFPVESILRRYGSWPSALRAVGVEITGDIPDEYLCPDLTGATIRRASVLCENEFDHTAVLVDDLYRLTHDLGVVPDWEAVETFGAWPIEAYRTAFAEPASVVPQSEAQQTADGLASGSARPRLRTDLEGVAETTDNRVWPHDVAFFGRYTLPSYLAVFDSLDAAFAAAGLDAEHFPQPVESWPGAWDPVFTGADSFLAALQRQYEELGDAPTMAEMEAAGTRAQRVYTYYDTWREALLMAGIQPNKRSPRPSGTKAELREALQELAAELGYPPKTSDVKTHGEFGLSTYYQYYPDWQSALNDAGLAGGATHAASDPTDGDTAGGESAGDTGLVNRIMSDVEESFEPDS